MSLLGEEQSTRGIPYQEDGATAGTLYKRWDHDDVDTIYIEREKVVDSVLTREKTKHDWPDRANAVWIPLYQAFEEGE